jgi:hypothetical protein
MVFVSGACRASLQRPGQNMPPIHVQASVPPEVRAEYDRPVGIGKLVTVDTAVPVDVTTVAAAVRTHLPKSRGQDHRQ